MGNAPGIDTERGRANEEVEGCCCKGLGLFGGGGAREDFLAGGDGGGGGMSVPAARDSEFVVIGGSWNLCVELVLVYVVRLAAMMR